MQPVVVAYGAGRDSTAMLIEMWKRRWRPDAILFANVGSEKRATYEFIMQMLPAGGDEPVGLSASRDHQ